MGQQNTFTNNIFEQKFEQSYVQLTYEKLDEVSRTVRESGDNVNIIINTNSRLLAHRHLNRIPYTSLIEYMPNSEQFIVKDGAHKRSNYAPKVGDLIAKLDKNISLIEPILKNLKTDLIYQHNPSERTGGYPQNHSYSAIKLSQRVNQQHFLVQDSRSRTEEVRLP